jgi:starch-binding outer membrane protein, SusD/RagB family
MRILLAGLTALALQGCGAADRLLSVEPQDRVPAAPVESSPANAQILATSAVADFECAFGAYVVMGGLIGEELDEIRSIIDRKMYDQRVHTSKDRIYAVSRCESIGVYTPLQTARVSAERVVHLLEGWSDAQVPQRATLIATMHAYAGYSTLLLGEGFCTTVISSLDANGNVVYGGEISRDSAFRVAEARFSAAIAVAQEAGASNVLNLALVGRARARLDLGDLSGARSDATEVPPEFTYEMSASASSLRRRNRVWAQERLPLALTSVGVPYRSLGDPRVPVTDRRESGPTGVRIFYQGKYPSAGSPIRMASGAEAGLIIAEADIAAGTAASLENARAIIDAFRARGNQSPLATADQTTLRAALIDQRRRELFLEGQHLGDIIRFDVTLTPPAGARFPGGGVYGSQKCLLLPDVEHQNNPVLGG